MLSLGSLLFILVSAVFSIAALSLGFALKLPVHCRMTQMRPSQKFGPGRYLSNPSSESFHARTEKNFLVERSHWQWPSNPLVMMEPGSLSPPGASRYCQMNENRFQ